jgi:quercetin dioxygenase-like cupin family protein
MLTAHKTHAAAQVAPHLNFDLKAEAANLCRNGMHAGRNSRTLIKAPDLRVLLVTAKKGTVMNEHRADGSVTILAVAGAVRLKLEDTNVELKPGELLGLDRALRHDVEALSDCAFLVTIGWPQNA